MGAMESWGNSEGTSGAPEARGVLTPYPFTTGKAALILFSQAEDLQARREGSARVKVISRPRNLEIRGGLWAGAGP